MQMRGWRRRWIWGAILVCWFALVAYEPRPSRGAAAAETASGCSDAGPLDASLYLIGDAGADDDPHDPLLDALAREAGERVRALGAERVAIAFLGDNIYPVGLRAPDHRGRANDERRLDAQLGVVRRAGARGFLVPGNHDWDNGGAAGWDAMKRQTRFVAARGATVVPPDACPGPVVARLGARLELVFLDTQWWLHDGPRPHGADSGCAEKSEAEIESALAGALRDAQGRAAIVLAHHPLRSGGPHGGRFGWKEHVFPFRETHRALWIPVPLLGSLGPVARMLGASAQDIPSAPYQHMIGAIERASAAAPPLLYAAGHEHGLQVLRDGRAARFEVVSGAGSERNLTWAYPIEGTLFAAAQSGYARIDSFARGAVELTIEMPRESGKTTTAFRACLAEAR